MKDFVRVGAMQGRLVVLPLYANEREIADLVFGSRAEHWSQVVRNLSEAAYRSGASFSAASGTFPRSCNSSTYEKV